MNVLYHKYIKLYIEAYKDWISPSSRGLDIGCGDGILTEALKEHFRFFVVGVDLIDYRKREIPFKIIDSKNKLPFKDKEFDFCMFNSVLHHCNSPIVLLNEALRIANMVLILEQKPTVVARFLDILLNKIYQPEMNTPLNLKTLEEWKICFTKLNLDFEYRSVKKPFLFYPFDNFSFRLKANSRYDNRKN